MAAAIAYWTLGRCNFYVAHDAYFSLMGVFLNLGHARRAEWFCHLCYGPIWWSFFLNKLKSECWHLGACFFYIKCYERWSLFIPSGLVFGVWNCCTPESYKMHHHIMALVHPLWIVYFSFFFFFEWHLSIGKAWSWSDWEVGPAQCIRWW